ncbi:unnamed protein product [Menidia menidia]|uniref:(Atlantic silverside) hypothetical protein n=1 Tax=Menidia menidia TaxID=238744 RepID=A0A8S4AWM8_9TELE|nr:unnamed protein product [Menidia menidia]
MEEMVHNDLRVEWIRQRVSAGFNLSKCPECFDELLSRDGGEGKRKIIQFLDVVPEDSPTYILFYKNIREKEIEIKVPIEWGDGRCSDPDQMSLTLSETEVASNPDCMNEKTVNYRTEVKVVYHTELHVAVNEHQERFLKSRTLYFIRDTKETVTKPVDMNEATRIMSSLFDFGMYSGHPLQVLQNRLVNVYIPLFTARQMASSEVSDQSKEIAPQEQISKDTEERGPVKPKGQIFLRDELLNRAHKFLSQVNDALQQFQTEEGKSSPSSKCGLQSEFRLFYLDEAALHIPELDLEPEVDVLISNPELVEKLEQCVRNWQTQITIVIEEQQKKEPQVGVLSSTWRGRETV